MYIKVRYPNDEKARKAMERDREFWRKIDSYIEPGVCYDTKLPLDQSVCSSCDFKRRIDEIGVFCNLAGGWIRHRIEK